MKRFVSVVVLLCLCIGSATIFAKTEFGSSIKRNMEELSVELLALVEYDILEFNQSVTEEVEHAVSEMESELKVNQENALNAAASTISMHKGNYEIQLSETTDQLKNEDFEQFIQMEILKMNEEIDSEIEIFLTDLLSE